MKIKVSQRQRSRSVVLRRWKLSGGRFHRQGYCLPHDEQEYDTRVKAAQPDQLLRAEKWPWG